jgi:hypothetical protein
MYSLIGVFRFSSPMPTSGGDDRSIAEITARVSPDR